MIELCKVVIDTGRVDRDCVWKHTLTWVQDLRASYETKGGSFLKPDLATSHNREAKCRTPYLRVQWIQNISMAFKENRILS